MKQLLLFFALLLPVCAFSQLNDTFEGSQVSSSWKGDGLSCFQVQQGRLLYDGTGRQGTYTIKAEVDYNVNMEWELDVALDYKPSTSNYVRICVLTTGRPSDEMYYLRIGYSGYDVSLCEWEAKTPLIKGHKMLNVPPSSFRVKLTLEEGKRWTLYTRQEGETAFLKEGVYEKSVLQDVAPRGNIYIMCYSSAKTLQGMCTYFDNFRVATEVTPTETAPVVPENPDPPVPDPSNPPGTAPTLKAVSQEKASELLLSFDKPVEVSAASFMLSEVGEADEVYISDDDLWVKLVWLSSWYKGKTYSLTYSGIRDKAGNECRGTKSIVSQFGLGEGEAEISVGSVLINEVMANPNGAKGLPETEYVELHNVSLQPLQLEGWTFLYGDKATELSSCLLSADGYVVLYRTGRTIQIDKGGQEMPLDKFPSALVNTGKALALTTASGKEIDRIAYEAAKPGVSWERLASAWHFSSDARGGTPGAVNSSSGEDPGPVEPDKPVEPDNPGNPDVSDPFEVAPQDVVFNELLPDPFADGSEYIELYNRSGKPIHVAGLSIALRKSDGSLSTNYPLSSLSSALPADGYALLTKSLNGVTPFYLISAPKALHELKLPVLANTSSTLVLLRAADKVVIDEVCYSSAWHASSVKVEKGVALERLNPDGRTQDVANWTSALESAGCGTPGYRNSQYGQTTEGGGGTTGIEPPVYMDATALYSIAYHLDESGYNCRANVYNLSGRSVARIANHELVGVEGELTWDGIAADGSRLGTGIYILYVELYHVNGKVHTYKKAFPVR